MTRAAALPAVLDALDRGFDAACDRWFDLLRIPSVSAQPQHREDCARAAAWCRDALTAIGLPAAIHETAGQPCVVARRDGPPGTPHILLYGHYDVQPAEPLALWSSPPFTPTLVEGPHGRRAVARGAVDDKGQVMTWLEALRAWHAAAGGPPIGVSVLIEGEEEIGSPNLEPLLRTRRADLAADIAVISDTNMWDIATPAITTRLRGMVYVQIDLFAAARDLHSGLFGGAATNAVNALTAILGRLHDAHGRVAIEGFYDGILSPSAEELAGWRGLAFDEAAWLAAIGLATPTGEAGHTTLERLWARPTADLNGIWGGYTGEGAKTVIAAEAHAKLSFRLVPGQDPQRILEGLHRFLEAHRPPDVRIAVQSFTEARGIAVPADSRHVAAARAALADEYGRPPVLVGGGGSIPVVGSLKDCLGIDSLLMGFGLDDDQVHSPDEKFELTCLRHGMRAHARLLAALAG